MATRKTLTKAEKEEIYDELLDIYCQYTKNGGYGDRFARFAINWYLYGGKALWKDTDYACEWVKRFDRHEEYVYASGLCKQAIIDADGYLVKYYWRLSLPAYKEHLPQDVVDKELKNAMNWHREITDKELAELKGHKSTPRKQTKKFANLENAYKRML